MESRSQDEGRPRGGQLLACSRPARCKCCSAGWTWRWRWIWIGALVCPQLLPALRAEQVVLQGEGVGSRMCPPRLRAAAWGRASDSPLSWRHRWDCRGPCHHLRRRNAFGRGGGGAVSHGERLRQRWRTWTCPPWGSRCRHHHKPNYRKAFCPSTAHSVQLGVPKPAPPPVL